ncbi:MAG: choice-of-anchor D domain-containing protein, partial [Acidobacteriaceae bacterium]|nr:choice-of-anchor D domain-containing protein [Acidobacteriaceae bacterium]
ALNLSALSSTIAAGASTTFTVTFAPGQSGLASATLAIGSNSYPLVGIGIAVLGTVDELQISYIDQTGVRGLPQGATPIDFGQVTSGTNGTATLTFTVANPTTSYSAVTVPNVTVTGSAFTLTAGTAVPPCVPLPQMPYAIQPGGCISFQITFSGSAVGNYTGTLAIGSRVFSLVGESITSPLPDLSFQLDEQPLKSQQQVHLSIQLASPSPVAAIGDLTLQFTPSVNGVKDDPAINFTATSGRELQVNVAAGAQTATFNGQSAITFQTGTTAGTITFTVAFPDKAPLTHAFTIAPEQVQITESSAVRQSPNLVVTLTGFDNTYSVGNLTFSFYDTSGHPIPPSPLTVNAASDFQQYFFGPSDAGGAFSMQASFPVLNGDPTQVGSVTVVLANSAGSTSTSLNFQ